MYEATSKQSAKNITNAEKSATLERENLTLRANLPKLPRQIIKTQ